MNSHQGRPESSRNQYRLRTPRPVHRENSQRRRATSPQAAQSRSQIQPPQKPANPAAFALGGLALVAVGVPVMFSLINDGQPSPTPTETQSSSSTASMAAPWKSADVEAKPITGATWNEPAISLGDVNSNGRSDVGVVDDAGNLLVYADSPGGFAEPMTVELDLNGDDPAKLLGGVDINGDTRTDLLALDESGKLSLLLGDGRGGFGKNATLAEGWSDVDQAFLMRNGLNGNPAIYTVNSAGELAIHAFDDAGTLVGEQTIVGTVGQLANAFSAGDFDKDGFSDLVAIDDGELELLRQLPKGGFAEPVTLETPQAIERAVFCGATAETFCLVGEPSTADGKAIRYIWTVEPQRQGFIAVPSSTPVPVTHNELVATADGVAGADFATLRTNFDWQSSEGQAVQEAVKVFTDRGQRVSFAVVDLTSGKTIAYDVDGEYYSASAIKGPYVVAINKYHPESVGVNTRAYIENVLHYSSNEAYAALWSGFGVAPAQNFIDYVGGTDLYTGQTKYSFISNRDLTKLWLGSYDYLYRNTNDNSAWLREEFATPNESFISNSLSDTYTTLSKAGWYPSGGAYNAYNDGGIVLKDNTPYVVVVTSDAFGYGEDLGALVEALDAAHSALLRE